MNPRLLFAWTLLIALVPLFPTLAVPPASTAESHPRQATNPVAPQRINAAVVTLQGVGGKGTGTIVDPTGIILTSEHIVRFALRGQVSVQTADGETHIGVVFAVQRDRDLALIRILTKETFPSLPLAQPDSLNVGQSLYAIDDPFTTSRILMAGTLQQIAENGDLLTDLSLEPGDSGGPLLNPQGEIIGVNRAIIRLPSESERTFGLATSINGVKTWVEQAVMGLERGEEVIPISTPSLPLGITVEPGTLIVQSVAENSLAASWGLRVGDRIVALNRRPLNSLQDLQTILDRRPVEALLTIVRNQHLTTIRIQF